MRKLKNEELKRISTEEFKSSVKTPIVVILDNVRSLNNIGSIFRTSDAFLVEAIYLCGITACPPHKDIQKTALGATETVDWKYFSKAEEAVLELKERNYKIFSVEQAENSISLDEFNLPDGEGIAVIFGNEVEGVSQELVDISDGVIELTQYGSKHSLNISVCAGITIWQLFQMLKAE